MARVRSTPVEALLEQSDALTSWLAALPAMAFDQPSVLPGWDVRTVTGHLVLIHTGLLRALRSPTADKGLPPAELVGRYRRDVAAITERTITATGTFTPADLLDQLRAARDELARALLPGGATPRTVETPRGPTSVTDFVATRIIELVVHADDLSRSLPDAAPAPLCRSALAVATRTLAAILAGQHPGRSIEVRVPPFAAVQCGVGDPGPKHNRGTPPNVVETDPATFFRLATGRISWAAATADATVHASGRLADLSSALPLLS
ncbi:MAG TPA: sterol carrier family protein [Propionibacteriaceae bacterium]|nr:sterol carrier family protein [Propionibacteriaceae bacterium]